MRRGTMTPKLANRRAGFTVVELLVVIAIIGVLVALLVPAIQVAREAARRSMCLSNLRDLGLASQQHESTFSAFPPGLPNCVDPMNFGITGGSSVGAWCQGPTWTIAVMPYMDEKPQFDIIRKCMETAANVCQECTASLAPPSGMICPSAEPANTHFSAIGLSNLVKGNYVGNFGSDTWMSFQSQSTAGAFDVVDVRNLADNPLVQMPNDPSMRGRWKMGSRLGVKAAQFYDGLSNTILASELLGYDAPRDGRGAWTFGGMGGAAFTTQTAPNPTATNDILASCEPFPMPPPAYQFACQVDANPMMPGATYAAARSAHPGGVSVVMADASTHFIVNDIDPAVWKKLGTRNARDTASVPD